MASRPRRRRPTVPADPAALITALKDVPHALRGDVLAVCDDNFSWVPDRSIDLVLTDPPFNIARDTNVHTYKNNTINSYRFDQDKGWDSHSAEAFIELLHNWACGFARVPRPGGHLAVFCADDYLSHLKEALISGGL